MSIINVAIVGTTVLTSLVESGDTVNVSIGSAVAGTSPLVTAGTIQIGNVTTLSPGANATVTNKGSGIAAILDFGIPSGPTSNITVAETVTLPPGFNATVNGAVNGTNIALTFGIPSGSIPTLLLGNVTTLPAGSNAAANLTTSNGGSNVTLNFSIPAGAAGQNGATPAFAIGNVLTLPAGSSAAANLTTSNGGSNVTLNFSIPAGATGQNGATPTFAIGNVVTLPAGSSAAVSAAATNGGANVTLNFSLPAGANGSGGASNWGSISNIPANFPTNVSLVSGLASSYAAIVHTHEHSTLANIPSNFPTNVGLVSGLSGGYAALNHSHNYVTSINGLTGAITLAAGANVTLSSSNLAITIDSKLGAGVAVDGGNYVGEPFSGITFTTQPQSQTLTLSSAITWTGAANAASGLALATVGDSIYALRRPTNAALSNVSLEIAQVSNAATLNTASYSSISVSAVGGSSNESLSATSQLSTVAAVGNVGLAVVAIQQWYGNDVSSWAGVARTTNNGSTWSDATSPFTIGNVPWGVATNDYGFAMAVRLGAASGASVAGGATNIVLQSADGAAWNARSLPLSRPWLVAGGGPRFVAVSQSETYGGSSTNAIYSIDNGVSWTNSSTAFVSDSPAAYGNSRFVAVHNSTAYMTLNGSSWASSNLPAGGGDYRRVSYAGGRFFAFRESNTTDVAISTDGTNWTLGTLPSAQNWTAAGAAGGYFAAAGNGTTWASGVAAAATGSANFTVSAVATGGASVSYQWQQSVDAGATWANVANATSSTLNLSGLTLADSGKKYRAIGSATGATPANSQSATLTVIG